jgi:3-methyladenine DNA glycosylase AlkD
MTSTFLADLETALASVIQPQRAVGMRAYMRDQFPFLGVPTPDRRLALKPLLRQFKGSDSGTLFGIADALWDLPQREYQYIALDLLAMHHRALDVADIPALLVLAQRKAWWDTVDGMVAIIGDVLDGRHDWMDRALVDENMWLRRIAMLHQLGWHERVDQALLFDSARTLAPENEFFIQKAIGWALRDHARQDSDGVRAFLAAEKSRLPALSYREAGKHILRETTTPAG